MVVKLVKQITEWSFSRFKQYVSCPLSAKLKFIDKLKTEDTEAQADGTSMHELAEEWASKKTPQGLPSKMRSIPKELKAFKKEFDELRKSKVPVIVETAANPWKQTKEFNTFAWGITRKWTLTGFFADDVWCRIKVDTHTADMEKKHVRVIDYKSGRIYVEDHAKQLELYAIGALVKYPWAETVTTELWYTDQQDTTVVTYTRKDLPKLKAEWEKRVAPMLNDKRFPARPGRHCSWCPYKKNAGGPCVH